MKTNFIVIIIILFLFSSCGLLQGEDEDLTFTKTSYLGNELKINGYYYKYRGTDNDYSVFFLFENGVATFRISGKSISEWENEFTNGKYNRFFKDFKKGWGLYLVSHDSLKIEFLSGYGELHSYPVTEVWKILNDSTIHFIKSIRSNGGYPEARNDTFHFKAFSPKPDSTNIWIP